MVKRAFDPEPYLPLTPAMFQLLVALADGEKHGYAIIKEVHRRTDGKVRLSAGTLYALIKRFVTDGLIDYRKLRPIARLGYMDYCVVDEHFSMQRPD